MSKKTVDIWAVDSLIKVFRTDLPPRKPATKIHIDAARNEYEHAQIAIRAGENVFIRGVDFEPLRHEHRRAVLDEIKAEFIGYVPVQLNTYYQQFPDEVIRLAPDMFPDPVWPWKTITVPANVTQPVWITLKIPPDAPAGRYCGAVRIQFDSCKDFHIESSGVYRCPLQVNVYPVSVPDKRNLYVTNWFFPDLIASRYNVERYTPAFYRIFEKYLAHMADHRQNIGVVPMLDLVDVTCAGKNKMAFSFDRLDKYISLLRKYGLDDLLEGWHIGNRSDRIPGWQKGKDIYFLAEIMKFDGKKGQRSTAPVDSEEARRFLNQFLPALCGYLKSKKLTGKWVQHICDEPGKEYVEEYRRFADLVRAYMPGIRIIDALQGTTDDLGIDIPVVFLTTLVNDFYSGIPSLRQAGRDVWMYICCHPGGHWPNRFMDFALIKTRILHWINFFYGCRGYLHWGYNCWPQPDPYLEVAPALGSDGFILPAGDSHIVYPGSDGPVNSIRFDVQRDSIEDYELLLQLAGTDRRKAMALAARLILKPYAPGDPPRRFDYDAANFRRVRRALLKSVSGA